MITPCSKWTTYLTTTILLCYSFAACGGTPTSSNLIPDNFDQLQVDIRNRAAISEAPETEAHVIQELENKSLPTSSSDPSGTNCGGVDNADTAKTNCIANVSDKSTSNTMCVEGPLVGLWQDNLFGVVFVHPATGSGRATLFGWYRDGKMLGLIKVGKTLVGHVDGTYDLRGHFTATIETDDFSGKLEGAVATDRKGTFQGQYVACDRGKQKENETSCMAMCFDTDGCDCNAPSTLKGSSWE